MKQIVFDEADLLLDMGFKKDIGECISAITKGSDVLEFMKDIKISLISASIDDRIRELAAFLMSGYKTVGFDKKHKEAIQVPLGLKQLFMETIDEFRLMHLLTISYNNRSKKAIVFTSTCEGVNFLFEMFNFIKLNEQKLFEGETIVRLHGKMTHEERKEVFKKFNSSAQGINIT